MTAMLTGAEHVTVCVSFSIFSFYEPEAQTLVDLSSLACAQASIAPPPNTWFCHSVTLRDYGEKRWGKPLFHV